MATNRYPTIASDFVELVENCRQEQKKYYEMLTDRKNRFSAHETRRQLQHMESAERKVDVWLVGYHVELEAYERAMKNLRTDELPGLYDAAQKD